MPNTYLSKDYTTNPTNGAIANFSVWLKRGNLGARNKIIGAYDGGAAGQYLEFFTDNTIRYHSGNGLNTTNAVFRDTSAWYHIVVLHNTGGSGASNQVKIWVNGNLQSLSTNSGATVNSQIGKNSVKTVIGVEESAYSSSYFDGSMSHFHFIDGTAYDATAFGQYDANGVWTIKTSPSVTYGTNGFFILKDGNSVTDQSGNSNNFTVGGGTLTKTEDCPSNVFATFNRLTRHGQNTNNNGDLLENGNTVFNTPSSTDSMKGFVLSTLGMNSGKYYCEIKVKAGIRLGVGICNMNVFNTTSVPYDTTNQSMLSYSPNSGNINYDGDSTYATGVTATENDILGFALDMDNNHWYIHKNGNYFNSGNPASGSTGTGSIISNITNGANYFNHDEMFFFASDFSTSGYARAEFNFGNGFFGTTAISSEGTNASGIGKFEYDVPAGYTALSTKGLNQ